jgi:hypothetical protein
VREILTGSILYIVFDEWGALDGPIAIVDLQRNNLVWVGDVRRDRHRLIEIVAIQVIPGQLEPPPVRLDITAQLPACNVEHLQQIEALRAEPLRVPDRILHELVIELRQSPWPPCTNRYQG